MAIRIETLMDMARRAAEGMTDFENVEDHEDASTAAREIVEYWEGEEGGLLSRADQDRFTELGGTEEDLDEVRDRTMEIIKSAIVAMRSKRVA